MAATSALTRDSIFQIARTLPATPKVLARLGELFHDINVSLDEVADLIKRDGALTARIIRISNSVVYGGSIRIGAIEDALNRSASAKFTGSSVSSPATCWPTGRSCTMG